MAQSYTRNQPLDNDVTLAADSPFLASTQHAVKTYVDNQIALVAEWPFDSYNVDPAGTADFTTIADALAAAPAKPIIVFEGTYVEGGLDCRGRLLIALGTVVIDNTVNSYGLLIDRDTNLTGRFEILTTRNDAGNIISGVKYDNTSGSAGTIEFQFIKARANNSNAGGAVGWWFASDTIGGVFVTLTECQGSEVGFGGTEAGVLIECAGGFTIQGGQYGRIRINHASATVSIVNPILSTAPVLVSGALRGSYNNSVGDVVCYTQYESNLATGSPPLVVASTTLVTNLNADMVDGLHLASASEIVAGVAELATQAETDAGTDDARIVTPLKLAQAATVQPKITKNLLYHSLTHDIWPEGKTLNDLADDTYAAAVWNVLNKDNAPDISGQAGGSTDPFTTSFRCTFDSNTAQAGIVQFLEAADTYPLRGQLVSLSADLWGTNVASLRMAVIVWTSTADTLTSDVVGTWGTGNPTLATNWAYIGTPAAITINSTRTRYEVENLTVPTNANNIGVFIWTDAAESSGDLWEVARVQLERGPTATEFVATFFEIEQLKTLRYIYVANTQAQANLNFAIGNAPATTTIQVWFPLPVIMRAIPSLTTAGTFMAADGNTGYNCNAPTLAGSSQNDDRLVQLVCDGATGLTLYQQYRLLARNDTTARLILSARL